MLKYELTLLVMTSEDHISGRLGFRKIMLAERRGIKPWDHPTLSPYCQISLGRRTNLPGQIYELAQSNGNLKAIRKNLEIRVIPERKKYEGPGSLLKITTDEFGKDLTYMLSGDLIDLVPNLERYGKNTPVILYWRK